MDPDDRRDALIEVFVRLAHREGRKPTTSEIAQEAGVAEGTIFRVFPTKEVLEKEAVQAAFCPAPVRRRITAIDPEGSLRDRLVDFTRIMQMRFTEVFGLMGALGLTEPPNRGPHQAATRRAGTCAGTRTTRSTRPRTSRCSRRSTSCSSTTRTTSSSPAPTSSTASGCSPSPAATPASPTGRC